MKCNLIGCVEVSISAAVPRNFTITHGRAVHFTNTKCLFHGAQRHFTQTKFAFHCAARNSCRREPCHFDQRGEISSLPLSRFRADFSATLEMTMVATDKAAAAIHENSLLFSIHASYACNSLRAPPQHFVLCMRGRTII